MTDELKSESPLDDFESQLKAFQPRSPRSVSLDATLLEDSQVSPLPQMPRHGRSRLVAIVGGSSAAGALIGAAAMYFAMLGWFPVVQSQEKTVAGVAQVESSPPPSTVDESELRFAGPVQYTAVMIDPLAMLQPGEALQVGSSRLGSFSVANNQSATNTFVFHPVDILPAHSPSGLELDVREHRRSQVTPFTHQSLREELLNSGSSVF